MDQSAVMPGGVAERARKYSAIRYSLVIFDTLYLVIFLVLFQALGFSKLFAALFGAIIPPILVIPAYILGVYALYYLLSLPLTFYSSFILEHKFSLSTQKLGDWIKDQLKSIAIFYIILVMLFEAFYFILKISPGGRWLIVSAFWIFFNLILARLVPVIIVPLFFKYKRLSDETLRERILRLAEIAKVNILDCFEIDFSKKTLKANAAFLGWGKTRRVVLADTLKDKYNYDEIEVILAHEFAHYKLKHLLKLILVNSCATIIAFYAIFKTSEYILNVFGLQSLSDIASLPVILLYFVLFALITSPFQNSISRTFERNADKKALEITGLKDAFISTMDKLANQNLADRKPNPVIKFLFFDHPPVDERIALAKDYIK